MIRPNEESLSKNNIQIKDIDGLIKQISKEKPEKQQETIFHFFKSAMELAGGKYYENINDLYKQFKEECIVRREDPKKILSLVGQNQSIKIEPDESINKIYGNCARWSYAQGLGGILTAMSEGHGELNGLVTMVGFEKNEDRQTYENIPENSGQIKIDRTFVMNIKGDIDFSNIKFIVFRIPIVNFPQSEMTEKEKETYDNFIENGGQSIKNQTSYIFRGYTFNQKKEGYAN